MCGKYLTIIILNITILLGQTSVFESNPGYISVVADTTNVPIYIDGTLMGHTPLLNPIPVLEGVHRITYYPPSLKNPFITYGEIQSEKKVFVLGGDTVNVRLNTILLETSVDRVKREYQITNYIGVGISIIFLWQLWLLSL